MQNNFKRFSVIAGFAVLLVVLIGNGLLTRRQLGLQLNQQSRLGTARNILLELERTESLLKDAETGQRGFLYTGDSKYLDPYNLARTEIDAHLDELLRLTAGDARQQASLAELRDRAHDKLAELAQTVALYRSGKPEQARAVVLSDSGLLIMNRIRQGIDQVEEEEAAVEAVHAAEYLGSVRRTILSIDLATILATVGLILLAYFILREMDLREKHARSIREREEWFRVTLTSIGDAVIVTDEAGKIRFLNPVAESLIGKTFHDAHGHDIHDVFPIFNEFTGARTQNPVKKVMDEGRVIGLANHTVLQHTDGHLIPIEDSAAPIRDDKARLIGVVLVFRDVTNERKSQDLLRKSEKLTTAARLSATVAHEINNPLEAVGNLIYIAKASPDASVDIVHHLNLAEQELERVAHITRQTLGFYRESNEAEPIDIAILVDAVLRLYSNKLKAKDIRVERYFGECPRIIGVSGELKQVISNLLSNAIDAVATNGTIRFQLECIRDGEHTNIRIVVEDDGPGISADHVQRIFEPFFTTKKDIGTGLGLWVTKEIVERHGGNITVRTREDNGRSSGAAFAILLPCDPNRHASAPPVLHGKQ